MTRRLAFLLALAFCLPVHAQQWPQKPVRVIVPFPPGGVTDSIARITADWLTQRLGQSFIAENRPGASGAIAAELVARAEADGYTLLSAASPQLAVVPHVQKIGYDPVKDFAPVSIVGTNPFALGCNAKVPPGSLKEFVAYVKARPGELSFASPGVGSIGHLTMALFLARTGLKMEAVLYKGGGPAIADTVAGHVPCYFGNLNEIIPHAGTGKLKVFAVSGEARARQLPDVPTVAEQGYPGFRTLTWNGYVAPAGTPREIV
jgi:tripartite-type tricarboxylate transporter receptor subunit TctC